VQHPVVHNNCHRVAFIKSNISLKMMLDNHPRTKIDQSGLNIDRDWFRV
jgi:hypothetical protein